MITLTGIIGLYIVAITIGKRRSRITSGTLVLLLLLAILQTGIVLFDMYSKNVPLQ